MKSRLFIVHGYQAHPQKHWFQWLCQQFPDIDSHIVALPESHMPNLQDWQQALQQAIGEVDAQTYIVAHSLGCVTTLHFLSQQAPTVKLGGLLLVAGFAEKLTLLPELDEFNQQVLPWEFLRNLSLNTMVLLSEDDADVLPAATVRLSQNLQAALIRLQGYGHFTQQDGCVVLPEAKQWLAQTLQANT